MVFIVIAVLVFLILIVFRTYRTAFSVIMTAAVMAGITTAVLAWGIWLLSGQPMIRFFSAGIGRSGFYHLMAAWYGMDLLCIIIICKRYREYKKINSRPQ